MLASNETLITATYLHLNPPLAHTNKSKMSKVSEERITSERKSFICISALSYANEMFREWDDDPITSFTSEATSTTLASLSA